MPLLHVGLGSSLYNQFSYRSFNYNFDPSSSHAAMGELIV